MRLLDRYLLRGLCAPLVYCLVGFLIFWVSFDLLAKIDEFQKAQLTAREVAQYYLILTPELLVTILPVTLLLALLYALTHHGRHNEIVAMRAAGLSLGRISIPYLVIAFLLSVCLLYLNENLVADASARAEALKNRQDLSSSTLWVNRINFRNARENRIWNIGSMNRQTFEIIDPHVEWILSDGTQKRLIAKRGGWTNEHWFFQDVELFTYEPTMDLEKPPPRSIRTNLMEMPEFQDRPEEIELQIKFQKMDAIDAAKRTRLSLSEIRYLRSHLELNKRDQALLETQYHARLAQPWTCMVVALVALPIGARANSRRNVMVGVAGSISIVFTYFILLRVGLALGTGGYTSPSVAAWMPNAFFAALGLFFLQRLK